MPERILGISAFYHDSAAAVLEDGHIVAAAQEERFTRKKHDNSFPIHAIKYVLEESCADLDSYSAVAFYDKPYLKFERLLETYHGFAPSGLKSYLSAIPVWIKEKLFMKNMLKQELKSFSPSKELKLLFPEHHLSHAASAFYPSPFDDAAILTIDGVGEWATTTIAHGKGRDIKILCQIDFPHSLGLLYSAFTYYCGFRVNSGEYKLMGLAPYGNPTASRVAEWKNIVLKELIDIRSDGSFLLNMRYFNYATGHSMCNDAKWQKLFGIPRRQFEGELTQPYMDLALVIQMVTEELVIRLAEQAKRLTASDHLVMAGGVALNCVANGKLLKKGLFKDLWIQPAAGDAGGALGAAYAAWHIWSRKDRAPLNGNDAMRGAYLGPSFNDDDVQRLTKRYAAPSQRFDRFDALCSKVSDLLAEGHVIGWFQGRMEYGPRALGNRSIIGDARQPEMQKKMNLHIKYREGFRPFAPSVMEEELKTYFDLDRPSPYMLLVAPVVKTKRKAIPANYTSLSLYDRLYVQRSDVPAITHVDFSARIQSVNKNTNPKYWELINTFRQKTGYGLIVNTSFNVRGEPIVCTPEEAFRCFMRTKMDYLVINNFLFDKKKQEPFEDDDDWREQYELD